MSSRDIRERITDAIEELEDFLREEPNNKYPEDRCHEIADSAVPVYTADIMQAAADDIGLATEEPECGPAFDGTPTPVNIIAANIYERISNALSQRLYELQEEKRDCDQCGNTYYPSLVTGDDNSTSSAPTHDTDCFCSFECAEAATVAASEETAND